jgi:hypothetical protein
MIFLPPCRLFVAQEGEQPAATELGTGRLDEKGAPPTGPDDLVDLRDQILRQNDVCSL